MDTNQKVLSTMTGYEIMATIEALEKQGLNVSSFKLLRQDKNLAEEVANLILSKQFQPRIDDQQFLSIMGKENYFGPTEWFRHFNVYLEIELPISMHRLTQIANGDCPFEKGKKVKDTHFLFCLPKKIETSTIDRYMNINTWRKILPAKGQPKFIGGNTIPSPSSNKAPWYENLGFATNPKHRYDWFLMYKGILPSYFSTPERPIESWDQYFRPNTIECISMHFQYYVKNKTYLNPSEFGRTCDLMPDNNEGDFVAVGNFDKIGLSISWGNMYTGYFLSRKLT
ncbi:MAG: hypothetical protein WC467_02735 [Patescibacteria group bacterium]